MTELLKLQPVLSASTADISGQTIQVSNTAVLTLTVTVVVSANTLDADLWLTGTNDANSAIDPTSVLPILATGKAITVLPSGFAFTPATGILAISTPAIGTYEMTLAFSEFPAFVRTVYSYDAGGGDVDVRAVIGAWSV
jgi:hypothetical protein